MYCKARQDYRVDIMLMYSQEESEEKIGDMDIVIFDLENIAKEYEDEEMLGYDDDAETAGAYNAIKNYGDSSIFKGFNEEDLDVGGSDYEAEKIRIGHTVYIKNIYIQEEYRNKGYGSDVLKNMKLILRHMLNLDVKGIFGMAVPGERVVEVLGNFKDERMEYTHDAQLKAKLRSLIAKAGFKFIENEGDEDYFYIG